MHLDAQHCFLLRELNAGFCYLFVNPSRSAAGKPALLGVIFNKKIWNIFNAFYAMLRFHRIFAHHQPWRGCRIFIVVFNTSWLDWFAQASGATHAVFVRILPVIQSSCVQVDLSQYPFNTTDPEKHHAICCFVNIERFVSRANLQLMEEKTSRIEWGISRMGCLAPKAISLLLVTIHLSRMECFFYPKYVFVRIFPEIACTQKSLRANLQLPEGKPRVSCVSILAVQLSVPWTNPRPIPTHLSRLDILCSWRYTTAEMCFLSEKALEYTRSLIFNDVSIRISLC